MKQERYPLDSPSTYVVVEQAVAPRTERSLVSTAKDPIMRCMAYIVIDVAIADAVPSNSRLICNIQIRNMR
jgi:hypothetical protein